MGGAAESIHDRPSQTGFGYRFDIDHLGPGLIEVMQGLEQVGSRLDHVTGAAEDLAGETPAGCGGEPEDRRPREVAPLAGRS
jgi:hypothetical protein